MDWIQATSPETAPVFQDLPLLMAFREKGIRGRKSPPATGLLSFPLLFGFYPKDCKGPVVNVEKLIHHQDPYAYRLAFLKPILSKHKS